MNLEEVEYDEGEIEEGPKETESEVKEVVLSGALKVWLIQYLLW